MVKNLLKINFLFLILLFTFQMPTAQETAVTIDPDREYIYFETEDPPYFFIETDPNVVICIEFAIERKILIDVDNQTDKNFFISYYGNESIGGEEIKTDNKGEASYELPREAWEVLAKGKYFIKIYYRAFIIEPSFDEDVEDNIKWGTLSVKNWEKAPCIEVFKSAEVAKGYDHLQKAKKFVKDEEYEKAVAEYLAAYKSWPHVDFIYNMATCYLKVAAKHYDNYLDAGIICKEISSEERKKVETLVRQLYNLTPEIREVK